MRCLSCDRIYRRCLCHYAPPNKLIAPLSLSLVQTTQERDHPKNSGALLRLGVENLITTVIDLPSHHQAQREQSEALENALEKLLAPQISRDGEKAKAQTLILYPQTETNKDRPSTSLETLSPFCRLMILDMTWGHSERLLRSSLALSAVSRLALKGEEIEELQEHQRGGSKFSKLRSGKRKFHEMSTLEATIYALISIERARTNEEPSSLFLKYSTIMRSYDRWIEDQLSYRSTR